MSESSPPELPVEGPTYDDYTVLGRKIKLPGDLDDPSKPYFDRAVVEDLSERINKGQDEPLVDVNLIDEEEVAGWVSLFAFVGKSKSQFNKSDAFVELLRGKKAYQAAQISRQNNRNVPPGRITTLLTQVARVIRDTYVGGNFAPPSADLARQYTPPEQTALRYRKLLNLNDNQTRGLFRLLSSRVRPHTANGPQLTALTKIYNKWPQTEGIDWTVNESGRVRTLVLRHVSLAKQLHIERNKGVPPEMLEQIETELLSGLNKLADAIERSKQRR